MDIGETNITMVANEHCTKQAAPQFRRPLTENYSEYHTPTTEFSLVDYLSKSEIRWLTEMIVFASAKRNVKLL